jgi:FkbM family methyltransferase
MGLRRRLREMLARRGLPVPAPLVRPKERPFYRELNRLRPGDVVLDFGANVGRTVAAFADRGCVVFGYEPNPDAFASLWNRVGGRPGVTLVNAAVGEADGTARLYLHRGYRRDDPDHFEASSLLSDKPNVDPDRYYDVPVRDAAALVEAHPQVALVKIDVEGAEYAILKRLILSGAVDRIARIAVETHEDRIESLRTAHAETEALIAARGLGGKIAFGWE